MGHTAGAGNTVRERGGDSHEIVQELEELFAFLGSMYSVFAEQLLSVCNIIHFCRELKMNSS